MPAGGVAALPPSFLVNQLLDLMARQRREVVPKCYNHPTQVRHGSTVYPAGGGSSELAGITALSMKLMCVL